LQVTNSSAALYVTPDQSQVEGFVGSLSPMLTVWRKLHVEIDSMTGPPTSGPEANYITGVVAGFTYNSPQAGNSYVAVRHSPTAEADNLFERGKFLIPGIATNRIIKSVTRAGPQYVSYLQVDGLPPLAYGSAVRLYDDDDLYLTTSDGLYPSLINLQSPPLPVNQRSAEFINAIRPAFAFAYILPIDANALNWNTQSNIVFKLFAPALNILGTTVVDSGNLQLKGQDNPRFWAFSLVFAYQPQTVIGGIPFGFIDDGDSDNEVPSSGGTPKSRPSYESYGYSVIYMESIRDYEFGRRSDSDAPPAYFTNAFQAPLLAMRYTNSLYGVIAHELGHGPGRQGEREDHREQGTMMEGGPFSLASDPFSPKTIARFRRAQSWTR
jgi:hypothetical protein